MSKKKALIISIVLLGLLLTTPALAYDGNLWQGSEMGEGMGHKFDKKAFGPGMKMGHKKQMFGHAKDISSEILGLSAEEIKSKIDSGMTMRDIIEEAGYTQESFKQAVQAKAEEKMQENLNQLVADGKITQEEADEKLALMQEKQGLMEQQHEEILAAQAELLDMSVDELKSTLESGKKMQELVEEAGFTLTEFHEKMAERRKSIEKARLEDLLEQGKITEEEYEKKLEFIESGKMLKKPGNKMGNRFQGIEKPLQELVDEGVINSSQLDKILEKLKTMAKNMFGGENKKFMGHGGQGKFMGSKALGGNND